MVMRPWQYLGFVSLIIHSMVEKSSTLCVSANGPVICHSIVPNEGQRMQSRVQVPDLDRQNAFLEGRTCEPIGFCEITCANNTTAYLCSPAPATELVVF
ncbi:hypothetical protein NC651_038739 [Populus alba x Populus x berolinensis]|nr:hypothetical protein NC651_038739 [Populus alba x Populus x berolinensis]